MLYNFSGIYPLANERKIAKHFNNPSFDRPRTYHFDHPERKIRRRFASFRRPAKPRHEWTGLFAECSGYTPNPRDWGSQVINPQTREHLKLVKESHHTVIVEYPDGTQVKRHKVKHNVVILD